MPKGEMLMNESMILTGDALEQLKDMPDNFIDCCVTSPPYYGLRDYGVLGQIGLEATPQEYIEKLTLVFREIRRVLKRDGTLWLNVGDSYAASGKGVNKCSGYKRKDLMGIPWKLVFALQADGWYLRQDIIWYKPNTMPESVKDRCTRSHEYIFLLSKSDRYYFDNEAIKEPAVTLDRTSPRGSKGALTPNAGRRKRSDLYTSNQENLNMENLSKNTQFMRNKRDVWSVPTKGYKGVHFATFPEKLIVPCILAGSRKDGFVLDPFAGSGTVLSVSARYGRKYIGIDINPAYSKIQKQRIKEEQLSEM